MNSGNEGNPPPLPIDFASGASPEPPPLPPDYVSLFQEEPQPQEERTASLWLKARQRFWQGGMGKKYLLVFAGIILLLLIILPLKPKSAQLVPGLSAPNESAELSGSNLPESTNPNPPAAEQAPQIEMDQKVTLVEEEPAPLEEESTEEMILDEPLPAELIVRSNVSRDAVLLTDWKTRSERILGPTPVRLELEKGRYLVTVNKKGCRSYIQEVNLTEGQATVVHAKLLCEITPPKPKPKSEEKVVATPGPKEKEVSKQPFKPETQPAKPSPPKPRPGRVHVELVGTRVTGTWAYPDFYIDQKFYDNPKRVYKKPKSFEYSLSSGVHQFRMYHPSHDIPTQTFSVNPDTTTNIKVKFRGGLKQRVIIEINGATVFDETFKLIE